MVEVNAHGAQSSPDWQSTNLAVFKLGPPLTERSDESRQGTKMSDRAGNLGMVCWRHRRGYCGMKRVIWGVEMEL